ncbi:MAG: hypothetical protein ABH830_04515, partial [Patescibacteria group bacterium]
KAGNNAAEQGEKQKNQNQFSEGNGPNEDALNRRSQVSNAVQEMLQVADRQGGIGEQVRLIAQQQNQGEEQMEQAMEIVKNRGRLKKFLLGPDYKNLETVEEKLNQFDEQLENLKDLSETVENSSDQETLTNQITIMEQVRNQLQNEVMVEKKSFGLFGWLIKLFTR